MINKFRYNLIRYNIQDHMGGTDKIARFYCDLVIGLDRDLLIEFFRPLSTEQLKNIGVKYDSGIHDYTVLSDDELREVRDAQ